MKRIVLLSGLFFFYVAGFAMAQGATSNNPAEQNINAAAGQSIEDRLRHLEEAIGRDTSGNKWSDRIQVGGLIKVEAGYGEVDFTDPAVEDEETGDADLATVELAVDAAITEHVEGHVLFKYEEDDLFVDEGFITLTGTEAFPAYLIAGRQYLPFGNFDSHFVTDPNTLVLGETNEGAVVAGYRVGEELLDIAVGAFNGKIDEGGDDDTIDSFVAAVTVQPVEALMAGASYTSNLTSSNAFPEAVQDVDGDDETGPLDDQVGGWSVFLTVKLMERFKLIGEYVAALDDFNAGELYDATDTKKRKPRAWNVELGAAVAESVEVAARYGGSDDGGAEFLPKTQYGAAVNWGVFENTTLALEYMHGEFEDDAYEVESLIAQLAIEF